MKTATMTATMTGSFDLERDATLRLRAGAGILLRACRGTLLVTREGDAEDHVLEAGDELFLSGRGRVVAWALAPSSLSVRHALPRPAGAQAQAHAACA